MRRPGRLTERVVRGLQPAGRDFHIFDGEVPGFSVVVYRSGERSFALSYRFSGRQRRCTIGRWPDWSVAGARERARDLRRQVAEGSDPLAARAAARARPRVRDLVERYSIEHLPRLAARHAADQRSMLRGMVLPAWGERLAAEICPADVERLLADVAAGRRQVGRPRPRPTPYRANRCGEVIRRMFGFAVAWGWRLDNPAAKFPRQFEVERERYLEAAELARLVRALEEAPDRRGVALVRMCLLTGARLGEVRTARFDQFNLQFLTWSKPAAATKQRRAHRVPVSDDVIALVRERRLSVPVGCGWLFPGRVEAGVIRPVQDIRGFWNGIRRGADLPDVRLHDLRHTFASLLLSDGASLEMIGRLLGHSQPATTRRYSHLMDRPARAGLEAVAAQVAPALRVVG